MKVIEQNPYRILGLLAGVTAREQTKQVNRLKQYIGADQIPDDDFSFPVLGVLRRTLETVDEASSKLNLDADKMSAAHFWFFKGYEITDEPAFEALKKGDVAAAKAIWERLIIEDRADGKRYWKQVNMRNYSAFHNWFILEVLTKKSSWSIMANILFLESDAADNFKQLITDATYKISKKDMQLMFLNQLVLEADTNPAYNINQLLQIIKNLSFVAKEDFLKLIAQKIIARITAQIENSKRQRVADKANAANVGEALYRNTKDDFEQLKTLINAQEYAFSDISDKLANEILQCGIEYFSHYKETPTDPSNVSMELFNKATMLAVGNLTKDRCRDQIAELQKWINDKPERVKQDRIKNEYQGIVQLIEDYGGRSTTIANAKALINQSKRYLNPAKNTLGASDSLYLRLSTSVATLALHYIIEEINRVMENDMRQFQYTFSAYEKNQIVMRIKQKLGEAWGAADLLGSLDMEQDFRRDRYNPNKESLRGLCNQLSVPTYSSSSSSGSSSDKKSGCYIATMAYGSYDHPQVMILRQFRDQVLAQSLFGRWFIDRYYHYSPKLVEYLHNKNTVNRLVRFTLNQLIKIIKQ